MKNLGRLLLLSLAILSLAILSLSSPAFGGDLLTPKSPLSDGQTLLSAGGSFEMGFFASQDNTSRRYVGIWYNKISAHTVVWVANREKPLLGRNGTLSITRNGTLILKDLNSTSVIWSAVPFGSGLTDPVAQLLDSGNFVTKEAGDELPSEVEYNSFAWQSFQHPADTHLPGLKLGWNRRTGFSNLTSWASAGDPSPGPYTSFLDLQGYPQITLWNGSTKFYRTGPSNGFQNADQQLDMFILDATMTPNEAYITIQPRNPSDIIRLTISPTGIAQGMVWIEGIKNWSMFWFQPKDECDKASPCGVNGICNLNRLVICDCAPGFKPKNAQKWKLQDNSEGCERKTALNCWNATAKPDGFMRLPEMKIPDSVSMVVDWSLTLEQCKSKCLSNCSCTAWASANTTSEMGCLMWTSELIGLRVHNQVGQDLYVRLAAADLPSSLVSEHSRRKMIMIIMSSLASGILALVFIILARRSLLRRKKGIRYFKDGDDDVELPIFDMATISLATDKFSDDNKLGEGGFGIVYKGKLAEGQEIAVKRLSKTSTQGIEEFMNEVSLIAKLQHRNLVRLLGCCIEGDERLLVYEYLPSKSLDANLFEEAAHLNWEERNIIINGIARGLLYLHQDSRFRIIHRDLKASNILLDKDMNPKIADFGLARIFHDDAVNKTQRVMGTYGYMSPEYAMDGLFSVKSDVFSFGVLVLEIISGQKNRNVFLSETDGHLLGHAWTLWNGGRCLELLDPTVVDNNFDEIEVTRCIKVGLLCVQEFPEDRPTMSSVVMMLVSDNMISTLPEPKQPGFLARRRNNSSRHIDDIPEDQSTSLGFNIALSLTLPR